MNKKPAVCFMLACAMCFTATLASCGLKKKDEDDLVPDKTKVTEEVWKQQAAVFATATNFTLDRVLIETGKSVGMMKLDGAVYYEAWGDEEGVYTLEDGTYYHYTKADASASWKRDTAAQEAYEGRINTPKTVIYSAAQAVAEIYSSFTFDEKTGVYSADEVPIEYGTLNDVEIIMSGGKIAKVECTYEDGFEGDGDERVTVDHIGTTKIEVPKKFFVDVPDETVNESSWNAIFTEAAQNFTMEQTSDGTLVGTLLVDGDKMELIEEDDVYGKTYEILSKEGGVYTGYGLEEGGTWGKEVYTDANDIAERLETFEQMRTYVSVFADRFSDFVLDRDRYVSNDLTISMGWESFRLTEAEVIIRGGRLFSLTYTFNEQGRKVQVMISDFGTTKIELPSISSPEPPTGGETVGDEKAWAAAINASAENFTAKVSMFGETQMTFKVDGDKLKEYISDIMTIFIAKEGDVYATYEPSDDGDQWVKKTDYSDAAKNSFDSMQGLVSQLADHYKDFYQRDGKYVCEKTELTMNGFSALCSNFEAVFADGKLVSLKFTASVEAGGQTYEQQYTFSNFGTTTVELPQNYTNAE